MIAYRIVRAPWGGDYIIRDALTGETVRTVGTLAEAVDAAAALPDARTLQDAPTPILRDSMAHPAEVPHPEAELAILMTNIPPELKEI